MPSVSRQAGSVARTLGPLGRGTRRGAWTMSKREASSELADLEKRTRNLFVTCRAVGDLRNERQARRDLASIQRVRRALRARPAAQVQAAA